jgi:hypothetical protein
MSQGVPVRAFACLTGGFLSWAFTGWLASVEAVGASEAV